MSRSKLRVCNKRLDDNSVAVIVGFSGRLTVSKMSRSRLRVRAKRLDYKSVADAVGFSGRPPVSKMSRSRLRVCAKRLFFHVNDECQDARVCCYNVFLLAAEAAAVEEEY